MPESAAEIFCKLNQSGNSTTTYFVARIHVLSVIRRRLRRKRFKTELTAKCVILIIASVLENNEANAIVPILNVISLSVKTEVLKLQLQIETF